MRTGVHVHRLSRAGDAGFHLDTSDGPMAADTVVVCTGAYQRPHRPVPAEAFPDGLLVLDAKDYGSPDALPAGRVLVVGSGQTGVQLAEELQLAGRDPLLSCGRAPWLPRRLGDLDIVTWVTRAGFYNQPAPRSPPQWSLVANVQATGARGGDDLHYRVLRELGVTLAARGGHPGPLRRRPRGVRGLRRCPVRQRPADPVGPARRLGDRLGGEAAVPAMPGPAAVARHPRSKRGGPAWFRRGHPGRRLAARVHALDPIPRSSTTSASRWSATTSAPR